MNKPRVNILVSTYNGEKYIKEQMESLLQQTYSNIKIYVRDDGSTDKTVAILKKYEANSKIYLVQGENLGFCGSFFKLLEIANTGEYWSFCDQDDIWSSNKIESAVIKLESQNDDKGIPLLYYSYSNMINERGDFLGVQKPPKGSLCFRRTMTGTFGVGFSMVINRILRDYMLLCDSQKVYSHDWLAGAIALGLGKVIIDETIRASYRRLNTSVTRSSFKRKISWFVKMLEENGDVKTRNMEFSNKFGDQLSLENKKIIDLFSDKHYSLNHTLKKVFYPKRWRPSLSSEIAMRVLMLFGKV